MLCNPNARARRAGSRPLALGITTQVRNIRQRMDPPINLVGNPGTYNKKVQVARNFNYYIFICYRILLSSLVHTMNCCIILLLFTRNNGNDRESNSLPLAL